MIYKRFTFLIILRILLLVTTVVIISIIFGDKRLFFNQIILGLLLVTQIGELIRFVNHTNRELTKFFYAIRYSDFSITFKQSALGKTFKNLEESMADIIAAYTQVKIEKEAQFHLLQMLVNQLPIGIIAVDPDDTITLINPTAEIMVSIPGLKNWRILEQQNAVFAREIQQLGSNARKLIEMRSASENRFLSVDVRTLIILDRPLKLITLQDINSEIEQKEIEAWHKLIRILTHEIMNSVTPISSLTETMQSLLQDRSGDQKQLGELKEETISDIRFSLHTIQKRSDGLLHFVENYRKLTKIPKPSLAQINVSSFLNHVEKLMSHELLRNDIKLSIDVDKELEIILDPVLVEQTLINLVTNSIHAVGKSAKPQIILKSYQQEKQTVIEVADNGKGIPAKEIVEIFIPFFTTKKEGSGIGLSLSKQIMSLHGGSIKVKSEIGQGTSFYLHFPPQK
jgi:two-component system nitrogen regulation sensor histidine kinase NtrY